MKVATFTVHDRYGDSVEFQMQPCSGTGKYEGQPIMYVDTEDETGKSGSLTIMTRAEAQLLQSWLEENL